MRITARRAGFAPALLIGLAVPISLGAAQDERATPDPDVVAAFDALGSYLDGLPDKILGEGVIPSLEKKVASGKAAYGRGQICPASSALGAYLKQTSALRLAGKSVPLVEDLYNRGRSLRYDVTAPTAPPSTCQDRRIGSAPKVRILGSDNKRFAAKVTFGTPRLWSVDAGGETWTQLSVPSVQSRIGAAGQPGVPSWQGLVALPRGARAVLGQATAPVVRETVHLNLHPFQPAPVDQSNEEPFPPPRETFMDRPFVKDARAYLTDAMLPPNPCAIRPLGQHRDLQIAQIQCVAGQYNPVTDEMRLFDSVSFEVVFDGGDGTFLTTQSTGPFEPGAKGGTLAVLNAAVVGRYVSVTNIGQLTCPGEELLILTHPNFHVAAEHLADWKRDKGILTTVIDVGAGTAHPSAGSIEKLIEDRFNQCMVRLSYVLLMGDSEFVPPSHLNYAVDDDASTGSDLDYAIYVQIGFDQLIPDFAVGRIPVDTAAEAQTVVDKIIDYEAHPPFLGITAGAPFYTTASIASYFQCCRTEYPPAMQGWDMRSFIETSEKVRNRLLASGYGVERIYTTDTEYQDDFVPDPTPRRYWDGDQLPTDLRPSSGFPWAGNTADIVDAFNAGRFNILHRDHGGSGGWVSPSFSTGNLASLHNGDLLPVVYSVNCKSGYFDRETDTGSGSESFMEQLLLLPNGGMVGGLGDVRNSPSWENSALTRGFYDATWPSLAPEFGGGTVKRRLGDILNHGKLYLMTQVGVAQPAGDVSAEDMIEELILWHAFGDPTLEMWTGNPHRFTLPPLFEIDVLAGSLVVGYAVEGAEITAVQTMGDGTSRPIGRAKVKRGRARLPFFVAPDPGKPIVLSASLDDAVSVRLTPRP